MNFLHKNTFLKEKLLKISIALFSLKKWQLLVGVVITAELFTFILNSLQSYIWWGYWFPDLIMIGTIDALFIAGILAPIIILLVSQTTRYEEYRKNAELEFKKHFELSAEEKKFRLYIENSIDVVTVIDPKGYIIYESPSILKNFGYEPADLVGRNAFEFIHPDDIKKVLDLFTRAVQKPHSANKIDFRFLKKNGVWAFVHVSGKNMITDPVINGIVLNVSDITERVEMETQLKKSISEKETLMKEIHHRVKNNFMTISSLLYLQSESAHDPKVTEIFLECQNRIKSMALIHEKLYQSENLSEIDVHSYIQRLVSFIRSSYITSAANISINLEIDTAIKLGPEKAISLGLIINELLSNVFKYAFPETKNGIVWIQFLKDAGNYLLIVKDNGVGFPKEYDLNKSTSLGLKLVKMMSAQMRGKFVIANNHGSEFKITFPT